MPRPCALIVLALCVWPMACSRARPGDAAPPIATPSMTVRPAVVAAGRPIEMRLQFAVASDAPPFTDDYTVFVHVLDGSGRMIGTADHRPPTPTRAWTPGSTVSYTHEAFAPTSSYVGPARMVVGLYSEQSGERLPLAGEAVEPRAIQVATFEIRERADPFAVEFRDGWHLPESPRGSGVEWRWSEKSAALGFASPPGPSDLVIELDQPNAVFDVAQHLEVRRGDRLLDAFDVEPGLRYVRRIPLDIDELGPTAEVSIQLVSDKTYVPARITRLGSGDTRQLGVRVFRAYVEPKE